MKKFISIFLSGIILCGSVMAADDPAQADQKRNTPHRPRVGVVLSGGGAKGMAHIGVLKMLEELEIPVDYIVGTSIGSIIGGLYALGYSADELDSLVRAQDWADLMNDKIMRRETKIDDKELDERCVVKIPFKNSTSFMNELSDEKEKKGSQDNALLKNLPSALVEGQKLYDLFTDLSVGYQDSIDFSTLPIPFACVAVDLNTKSEVVFRSGNIVEAMRSSMSIPGYFAPVRHGRRFMVDGGMLNNFPVDVVREMGAETIIGVDLHYLKQANSKPVETIPDMFSSMLSMMNGEKFASARRDCDLMICPDTRAYGTLAFDEKSLEALIDSGYVAAERMRYDLEMLAGSQKELARREAESTVYPSRDNFAPPKAIDINRDSVFISQIEISGADPNEMMRFLKRNGLHPGQMLTGEKIDDVISYIYNTGAFSKVTYSITGDKDYHGLRISMEPERQHVFGFGFRFDTQEMAALLLDVNLGKHKFSGLKLDSYLRLAQNPQFYINTGLAFSSQLQFNVNYHFRQSRIDAYKEGVLYDRFVPHMHQIEANFQEKSFKDMELKLGARWNFFSTGSIEYFPGEEWEEESEFEHLDKDLTKGNLPSLFANLKVDNYDRSYFPTRGVKIDASCSYYFNRILGNPEPFWDTYLHVETVIPFGSKVALLPQMYGRAIFGSNYVPYVFQNMAGARLPERCAEFHMPFIGSDKVNLLGSKAGLLRADLRVNVTGNHYITLMANYISSFDAFSDVLHMDDPALFRQAIGGGLGYSLNTVLGPIGLDLHWSTLTNKAGVSVYLGYNF